MKLPFKIVWCDSEDDLREERQEERIRDLEKRIRCLEDSARIWPNGRMSFRPHSFPVGKSWKPSSSTSSWTST